MPIIPGEVCIGSATFFSFVAVLLLIFTHVGQLNTSTIPRGISMVKMNVSGFGDALSQSHAGDSAAGLYTTNATAPLEEGDGLRQIYAWGFYSHCAYVAPEQGICSNKSQPNLFQPFDTMVADAPAKFHTVTQFIVPNSGFTDSSFLGSLSRGAYWLCFIGSILAALAMIFGVKRGNFTFFLSATFAILGSLMLLISAAIWTSVVVRAQAVNGQGVNTTATATSPIPLGIHVSFGPGVWLLWAAFASLFFSTIPYVVSCFTYRG